MDRLIAICSIIGIGLLGIVIGICMHDEDDEG